MAVRAGAELPLGVLPLRGGRPLHPLIDPGRIDPVLIADINVGRFPLLALWVLFWIAVAVLAVVVVAALLLAGVLALIALFRRMWASRAR